MKIDNCMLAYCTKTKECKVCPYPDIQHESKGFLSFGKWNVENWNTLNTTEKIAFMLIECIRASTTFNIPIKNFYNAIKHIDEVRLFLEYHNEICSI